MMFCFLPTFFYTRQFFFRRQYMSTVLKRHSRGILQQAKGHSLDQLHSDQMVLGTVREEAGLRERQPKPFKTKLAQGEAIRLESTQIRWFVRWPGRRLDLVRGGQRCSMENWKKTLGSQGTQLENWHSDRLKKTQLTLSHGQKKKGDKVADDEDVW